MRWTIWIGAVFLTSVVFGCGCGDEDTWGATRGEGATASVGTGPPSLPAVWRTTIFTMPGLLTNEGVAKENINDHVKNEFLLTSV